MTRRCWITIGERPDGERTRTVYQDRSTALDVMRYCNTKDRAGGTHVLYIINVRLKKG